MREICIHGLKRSGQHAIANWLLQQSLHNGDALLFNNILDQPTPEGEAEVQNMLREIPNPETVIYCVEDHFIDEGKRRLEGVADKYRILRVEPEHVVVLRDPYNMRASRLRQNDPCRRMSVLELTADCWKDHARHYLDSDMVPVSFNRWTWDRDYRAGLALLLKVPFTDAGHQEVPDVGGGSSFDGLEYDGRASEMPVLDRYKEFEGKAWWPLLFDEETRQLADRIFADVLEGVA